MESEHWPIEGNVVESHLLLEIERAKRLATYLLSGRNPYATYIGAWKHDQDTEKIILEVEPEVSQKAPIDIRRRERLAVEFRRDDLDAPEVLALRRDFPRVPHLNLRDQEFPRSLCLYELVWEENKRLWTPERFVERIREWLSKTALEENHNDLQALEPFLPVSLPKIILPNNFLQIEPDGRPKHFIVGRIGTPNPLTLMAIETDKTDRSRLRKDYPSSVGIVFVTNPAKHGIIYSLPKTIKDLHDLLVPLGTDLIKLLRNQFLTWSDEKSLTEDLLKSQLMLLIVVPHIRREGDATEEVKAWVFNTMDSILDVGIKIGIMDRVSGLESPAVLHIGMVAEKIGEDVQVLAFNPVQEISREKCASQNGLLEPVDRKFTMIGVGALGGYIALNMVKTSFGKWDFVDSDIFLPHNFARHVAFPGCEGSSKAEVIAEISNLYSPGEAVHRGHKLNLLKESEETKSVLDGNEMIVDCSASISVARNLVNRYEDVTARRISLFLNPKGTDLVLLAEPRSRDVPLDVVEMQYYRLLSESQELADHLDFSDAPHRYARSCGDISSTMQNDFITLLSSIGSAALKRVYEESAGGIFIWKVDPTDLSVQSFKIDLSPPVYLKCGDWTVVLDLLLVDRIRKLRDQAQPNETGGSLIGQIDLFSKKIYCVSFLPTPDDSVSTPVSFVRGMNGNGDRLKEVGEKTAFNLMYIGEWHSHPKTSSSQPSGDDIKLLRALSRDLNIEGLPGLILIASDRDLRFIIKDSDGEYENTFEM